mmetsp:Transcript_102632/g.294053  ORF Transcript_102632/g.294053 Transcript_102632/m.294053 type:complete len:91 (+) Transcript_102632:244-516(+)
MEYTPICRHLALFSPLWLHHTLCHTLSPRFTISTTPYHSHSLPLLTRFSPEQKLQKRAIELNNGRAAQMGILALMMHECVDGKPYIFFDL